jgi:hypothetical protein
MFFVIQPAWPLLELLLTVDALHRVGRQAAHPTAAAAALVVIARNVLQSMHDYHRVGDQRRDGRGALVGNTF